MSISEIIYIYVTRRGVRRGPALGILAEIASCQLEYTYLAKVTSKRQYFDLVRIFIAKPSSHIDAEDRLGKQNYQDT